MIDLLFTYITICQPSSWRRGIMMVPLRAFRQIKERNCLSVTQTC